MESCEQLPPTDFLEENVPMYMLVVFVMIWANNLAFHKEWSKGWETLEKILAQAHIGEALSDKQL